MGKISRNAGFPAHVHSLSRPERAEWGMMGMTIVFLHVVGIFILLALVTPHHYVVGNRIFGLGLGLTAYTLGLRHAFDADHISAIDNTTRKLIAEGKRPLSVGFFFSLGHSTIVFLLSAALAVGIRAVAGLTHGTINNDLGIFGTLISGSFLYLIAFINLGILIGIIQTARGLLSGRFKEADLESLLQSRGLINRLLSRTMKAIRKPSQMYPVGVLFGLGFDTASEVALLILAGGAAAASLPWYAVLALPILFAAGMSLFDTLDGSFMNFAYSWAFSNAARKIYYNITITGLSVAVALFIGTVELAGVLSSELNWTNGFWSWVANFNINQAGFFIVALFVVTWAVALLVWRVAHIEERWSVHRG